MALAFDSLIKALNVEEFKALFLDIAKTVGKLVTDTWKEGDPSRELMHVACQILADRDGKLVQAVKGGWLDTAEGDWVDLNGEQVFNTPRVAQTFATGEVTLTNPSSTSYTINIGDLVVRNPTTKKSYRNTEAGVLNSGGGTVTLDILALEAGSASTSQAGTITELVTTYLGVTCTNAAVVIGRDKEFDTPYKQRCRDARGALSPNGPTDAYRYIATSTKRSDGTTVDINRVKSPAANGVVTVTIASPTGAPSAGDLTDVTNAIQTKVVPLGVTATVAGATPVTVPITYTVYVDTKATPTDAELTAAISTALTEYFKTLPIGGLQKVSGTGKVWHDLLRGVISDATRIPQTSAPAAITVDLVAPAADVAIAATEVPVLGFVTPTVTRVTQS